MTSNQYITIYTVDDKCPTCEIWQQLFEFFPKRIIERINIGADEDQIQRLHNIYGEGDTIVFPLVIKPDLAKPLDLNRVIDIVVMNATSHLRSDIQIVEFTKKDGTLRKMRCTLQHDIISKLPNYDPDAPMMPRRSGNSNITVWDIEAQGWRSFNIFSLTDKSWLTPTLEVICD